MTVQGHPTPSRFRRVIAGFFLVLLVIGGMLGSTASAAPIEALGNKGVAYRLFEEVYNAGDMTAANEMIASSAVIHTPGGWYHGPEGCGEYIELLRADFPNATFEILDTIVTGDTVVVRWTLTADGDDASPTLGSDASVDGMAMLRVENYLITELWMQ